MKSFITSGPEWSGFKSDWKSLLMSMKNYPACSEIYNMVIVKNFNCVSVVDE